MSVSTLDARGGLVLPDHFGQRSGVGLDPCAALAVSLVLPAGAQAERVFLLGYAPSPEAARQLAGLAAQKLPAQRIAEVRAAWDRLLGAATVKTPDPQFDVMVNRWLLDQPVAVIEGSVIPSGVEDAYDVPRVSAQAASVYEHAARALDRSLPVGAHGLPLMGSGDWNDGMNRVGHEGRGESVWLGWFLCDLVAGFAPLARAQSWEQAAVGWKAALLGPARDGAWFKRAFFDDGQALGSSANSEARIDLIAQAWAVLSGVAPPDLQRLALQAMQTHLADDEAGLIRLLDPPLVDAQPSAGYIQAYPPGVRENGSQYSHAGVWALMAQARFHADPAHALAGPGEGADLAYRYFTYLSPAHRSRHPVSGPAYAIEPYVMAGDVYSQPPYVGRGGWSWYTGAAAWMQRAAVESIFGLRLGARELSFTPCLPAHWHEAELTLRRDGRTMRFIFWRAGADAAPEATAARCRESAAKPLCPGELLSWPDLPPESCFVIALAHRPGYVRQRTDDKR